MKFLTAFAVLCPLLTQVRAKTDDEPRKLQGGDLTINGVIDGTILSQAIEIANVTSLLDSEGPFTLFAPEDAAFGPVDAKVELGVEREAARLSREDSFRFGDQCHQLGIENIFLCLLARLAECDIQYDDRRTKEQNE